MGVLKVGSMYITKNSYLMLIFLIVNYQLLFCALCHSVELFRVSIRLFGLVCLFQLHVHSVIYTLC